MWAHESAQIDSGFSCFNLAEHQAPQSPTNSYIYYQMSAKAGRK